RPCADLARPSQYIDRDSAASREPWTAAPPYRSGGCPARAARHHSTGKAADCPCCGNCGIGDQAVDVDVDGRGTERDAADTLGDCWRARWLTHRRAGTPRGKEKERVGCGGS